MVFEPGEYRIPITASAPEELSKGVLFNGTTLIAKSGEVGNNFDCIETIDRISIPDARYY